jgi:hypothetical protein
MASCATVAEREKVKGKSSITTPLKNRFPFLSPIPLQLLPNIFCRIFDLIIVVPLFSFLCFFLKNSNDACAYFVPVAALAV